MTVLQAGHSRQGSFLVLIVVLFVLALAVGGGTLWLGKSSEARAQRHIEEGLSLLDTGKSEEAVASFETAAKTLGVPHAVWRTVGMGNITQADLHQLLISSILVLAYERFFEVSPQPDLLKKADEALKNLSGPEHQEVHSLMRTAGMVSEICRLISDKQFDEAMKKILLAEKEALPGDRDFFIIEIRLLIACGKGLRAPAILGQARELLWFITSEGGVKGPKVDRLWKLLSQ